LDELVLIGDEMVGGQYPQEGVGVYLSDSLCSPEDTWGGIALEGLIQAPFRRNGRDLGFYEGLVLLIGDDPDAVKGKQTSDAVYGSLEEGASEPQHI